MDEESSFSGESVDPEPGAEDLPVAIPQGWEEEEPHDIEMKDVEYDPNLPPPSEWDDNPLPVSVQAAWSDPPPKDDEGWGDTKDDRDMIVEDERFIIETGGATPITPVEDQLLDDQVGTGAETPSRAVTDSLSSDEHEFACHFASGK